METVAYLIAVFIVMGADGSSEISSPPSTIFPSMAMCEEEREKLEAGTVASWMHHMGKTEPPDHFHQACVMGPVPRLPPMLQPPGADT